MDGAINYRAYTNLQLQEALQTIDRDTFPLNYSNLTIEVQHRHLKSKSDASSLPPTVKVSVWHEHTSSGTAHDTMPAPLWKYVSLFAVIYYAGVLMAGTALEYFDIKRASSIGNAIVFVAAFVIGRRFVTRHERIFTSPEAHRLMFYCLIVVTSMEAVVVFFHPDLQGTLSLRSSIIALTITVVLNAFVVWVAYRLVARKDMQNRLKTMTPGAA